MRMTKQNLRNIRSRFQQQTGVTLDKPAGLRPCRVVVLAAVMVFTVTMLAFGYRLFSPLGGDELSLSGTYEGGGIVSVFVENRSDNVLEFQNQAKLVRWVTSEEVPRIGGDPVFYNTRFEAHTSGVMTIDLSGTYDMQALEQSTTSAEWFYLLLTNRDFLFGHDWMCSVTFGETAEAAPEIHRGSVEAERIEEIEEELQFYFREAYDELLAFNGANFQYQQKVEELLARFKGTVVPSLNPSIMVGVPNVYLDPEPKMGKPPAGTIFDPAVPEGTQYLLTWSQWSYTDAYGRMVASSDEKAWVQVAVLPQREGQTDGGVTLPLRFLFVYDAEAASDDNYVFLYGQLHSFGELERYKVLKDEHYAVYDATDLIYTDLDAYLDYFLSTREDVFCDEGIRKRVHAIYEFYQDKENIKAMYGYYDWE